LLWYPNTRFSTIKLVLGVEGLFRLHTKGTWLVDTVDPFLVMARIGVEIPVSKNTGFFLEMRPRYTFSTNTAKSTGYLDEGLTNPSRLDFGRIFSWKIISGPGIVELFAPAFGLRLQP